MENSAVLKKKVITRLFNPRIRGPLVSIIIRVKNEKRMLRRILKTIGQQRVDFNFEVIVVASSILIKGTHDLIKDLNYDVKYVVVDSFTWGKGINTGAKNASGRILALLSVDACPSSKCWLQDLIRPLLCLDGVVATFGRQLPIDCIDPFEEVELRMWFPTTGAKPLLRCSFSSANSAVRRDIWEMFNFDEKLNSMEDIEWAKRVIDAGYKILYVPEATVYHSHKPNLERNYRRWYWRSYEAVKIFYDERYCHTLFRIEGSISFLIISYVLWSLRDLRYFISHGYSDYVRRIPFYEFIRQYSRYAGAKISKTTFCSKKNFEFLYYKSKCPFYRMPVIKDLIRYVF